MARLRVIAVAVRNRVGALVNPPSSGLVRRLHGCVCLTRVDTATGGNPRAQGSC